MKKILIFLLFSTVGFSQQTPFGAIPTPDQLAWHDLKYYAFIHFGPNTFTDKEWGNGTETEDIFNPTKLDCRQWAKIAKEAGMQGIIITAKHHDGFCLFPSNYSKHTVRESKWKDGKGDVLKELSAACKEYGLKMGIYISPWDRNHPTYGTPEYNETFVNMLKEVLTNYGDLFEVWFDGANGEGPNGKKQVYDFPKFNQMVKTYQPHAVIFSDAGPDIRWVGNEKGIAGETLWNTINRDSIVIGHANEKTLNQGEINGKNWLPAECDVSIRPGWFYHKKEDDKVKTAKELMDLWYKSVGRGANLLLNIPVDDRGLINENDEKSLIEFKNLRNEAFKINLAASGFSKQFDGKNYQLKLSKKRFFNCLAVQEQVALGQRVKKFDVQVKEKGKWKTVASGTTIGCNKILQFPTVSSKHLRLVFDDALAQPLIQDVEVYLVP